MYLYAVSSNAIIFSISRFHLLLFKQVETVSEVIVNLLPTKGGELERWLICVWKICILYVRIDAVAIKSATLLF
jgi:hypothetical protein